MKSKCKRLNTNGSISEEKPSKVRKLYDQKNLIIDQIGQSQRQLFPVRKHSGQSLDINSYVNIICVEEKFLHSTLKRIYNKLQTLL